MDRFAAHSHTEMLCITGLSELEFGSSTSLKTDPLEQGNFFSVGSCPYSRMFFFHSCRILWPDFPAMHVWANQETAQVDH